MSAHLWVGIAVKSDELVVTTMLSKQKVPLAKIDRIVDEEYSGRNFPGPVAYLSEPLVGGSGEDLKIDLMPSFVYGMSPFGKRMAKGATDALNEHLRRYRAGLTTG